MLKSNRSYRPAWRGRSKATSPSMYALFPDGFGPAWSVGVGNPAKGNVDLLYIKVVGVVGTAVPIKRLFRCLALLVGNVFDEFKVTRWTAAIFGRAATFTSKEAGMLCARYDSTNFFDDDSMFPVVAKIVDVPKLSYS
jgi:hypothetical protein